MSIMNTNRTTAAKMVRLQVELSEPRVREIESLMEAVGARTKAEFLNIAVTLLRWAVKERQAGRIIASVDEKSRYYKELIMPGLSEITASEGEHQPLRPLLMA